MKRLMLCLAAACFAERGDKLIAEMEAELTRIEQRTVEMQNLEIMQGSTDEFIASIDALAARSRKEVDAEMAKRREIRRKAKGELRIIVDTLKVKGLEDK